MKFPLMRNNMLREDLDAVIEHLKQDDPMLTHGANVRAFEAEWSEWLGVKYSVFVNSGSSANLLTMAILRIRHPGGGSHRPPSSVGFRCHIGFAEWLQASFCGYRSTYYGHASRTDSGPG